MMLRTDRNMLEAIANNLRDALGLRKGGSISIAVHDVPRRSMNKLHQNHDMDRMVPDDTTYAIASMRGSFIWDRTLPPTDTYPHSVRVITMGDADSNIQISLFNNRDGK